VWRRQRPTWPGRMPCCVKAWSKFWLLHKYVLRWAVLLGTAGANHCLAALLTCDGREGQYPTILAPVVGGLRHPRGAVHHRTVDAWSYGLCADSCCNVLCVAQQQHDRPPGLRVLLPDLELPEMMMVCP
jgi:hypothetical protein